MRAVCINHSKRLYVPARERENDLPMAPVCPLGTHQERDIIVEPGSYEFQTYGEFKYKTMVEQFEMFWQQAI